MDDLVEEDENSLELDSPVAQNGPRLTTQSFNQQTQYSSLEKHIPTIQH